jgi:hypothetical protein
MRRNIDPMERGINFEHGAKKLSGRASREKIIRKEKTTTEVLDESEKAYNERMLNKGSIFSNAIADQNISQNQIKQRS